MNYTQTGHKLVRNITNVKGFKCWGAHTGIKSLRRDLAIIYSEKPCAASATFTQNDLAAAPIVLSRKHIKGNMAQAIVINAGNANAGTGKEGYKGAEAMAQTLANELKIDKKLVLVASTGVIGEPFPTDEIVEGIKVNAKKISTSRKAGTLAANAILTTDTFAKEGHTCFTIKNREINIAGIAKGSGMIHPNMATMLAFIFTDVSIDKKLLDRTVKFLVKKTFNMITVDGDTSTNDMVAVLANGMAGNKTITSQTDPDFKKFREHLEEVMVHLAQLIVSDGEGATKFIEYRVIRVKNETIARKLVRAISGSLLVKTAMFGRDPNWGRIVAAAGNGGVNFDINKVDLFIGDAKTQEQVLRHGSPLEMNKNRLKKLLRNSHISIRMEVNTGKAEAIGWGTDISTDYVLFNSVYTT
ncbi:MAG TPA: bifunctional glutamate N-acetyltransferase/amino-acid acetyltransferase ArgJ [Ignavibacteriaceae bacterium]|nr:bifunctional glutamate N-acetyltransferase/amino-acid acetyltransferase ArgJ [Ignavibacteriaceae bacterium]